MSGLPKNTGPRLAVRALIVEDGKLLLVNAYGGGVSDLWCAPGGGVEKHQSLPENLVREVYEETGLTIEVGEPAGVNEFHDQASGFHQVDFYFRARVIKGALDPTWRDADDIVDQRRFVTREDLSSLRVKPDALAHYAFEETGVFYDPLERLVR